MSEELRHHLGHRLTGYLDGELPRGTRQLVSAHLALCSTCRVAAVKDSHTKAGLRDHDAPAPSDSLLSSLLSIPSADGPSHLMPGADKAFPIHTPAHRRRLPGAHLLAAGVAGVAALTVGSAVLATGPTAHSHAVRHASVGGGLSAGPTISEANDTAPAVDPESAVWVPEPIALPALPHIEGAELVRAR
ncbi:MAG TPA: zf-HC2 domain-containing protein [Sporichthyaceae bacterium]|nr:zf-HC2 domain-containing protein [Sporichthyaceae bacterium]